MKIFEYQRISTSSQEVAQQHNTVREFIDAKGWTIDESISDEGVSGSVSYKDRNLYKLIQRMDEGDILIVSEISRLGRSMSDLNKLVNDELKPRKLRLIIVKMGLDLDCSNLKAIDEMILFAFGFSAQIERELLKDRTQSAIDVRKQKLAENGSFISRKGNVVTALGRPKGFTASKNSIKAAVVSRKNTARSNENNLIFKRELSIWESKYGPIDRNTDLQQFVDELNSRNFKTAKGLEFDICRARAMVYKVRRLYAS